MTRYFAALTALSLLAAGPAQAYVGPGAGLGALAAVVAVVVGVLLLAVGFLWFPIKRMLKNKKAAAGAVKEAGDS